MQEIGEGRSNDPAAVDDLVKEVLALLRGHGVSHEVLLDTLLRICLVTKVDQIAQPPSEHLCGSDREADHVDVQYQAATTHNNYAEGITTTSLAAVRDQLARVGASSMAATTKSPTQEVKPWGLDLKMQRVFHVFPVDIPEVSYSYCVGYAAT